MLLVGLIARRLGGGAFAQGLAALAALMSPVFLGQSRYYSMNALDLMLWTLAVWALVGCYALLGPRAEPLVTETLGIPHLMFLRPVGVVGLMVAGTVLGGLGGWLARGRATA